jgi:hypothetical protein
MHHLRCIVSISKRSIRCIQTMKSGVRCGKLLKLRARGTVGAAVGWQARGKGLAGSRLSDAYIADCKNPCLSGPYGRPLLFRSSQTQSIPKDPESKFFILLANATGGGPRFVNADYT